MDLPSERRDFELLDELDKARMPVQYLANLFSVGDQEPIRHILRKMLSVRSYKRRQSVDNAATGQVDQATIDMLADAGLDEQMAEDIYRLTTLPTIEDRFVFPPYHREVAIEELNDPLSAKGSTGFGYLASPKRGA